MVAAAASCPETQFRQFGGGIGVPDRGWFAAVVWLASGFYIVDASQRGVVLQFGRFQEPPTPACAGACRIRSRPNGEPHRRAHRRDRLSRLRAQQGAEEALMLTDDENIVEHPVRRQYVLKDPQQYLFNNRNADDS